MMAVLRGLVLVAAAVLVVTGPGWAGLHVGASLPAWQALGLQCGALALPCVVSFAAAYWRAPGLIASAVLSTMACVGFSLTLFLTTYGRGPAPLIPSKALALGGAMAVALLTVAAAGAGAVLGLHTQPGAESRFLRASIVRNVMSVCGWLAFLMLTVSVSQYLLYTLRALSGPLAFGVTATLVLGASLVSSEAYAAWIALYRVPVPEHLQRTLAWLSSTTGLQFGMVLVVGPPLDARALFCEVRWRGPSRAQLVVSERLCAALDPLELRAVVAYEAAHLAHGDLRTGIVLRLLVLGLAAVMLAAPLEVVLDPMVDPVVARVVSSLAAFILLKVLIVDIWRRASENRAERFAAGHATGAVFERALRKLSIEDGLAAPRWDLSIWTTHSALLRRVQRLECAEVANDRGSVA